MRIIAPIEITPAILTSSNVTENDYAAWSNVTAYVIGNRVIYNHAVYESLTSNTNKQPDTNPTDWLYVSATNRYRMFDDVIGNVTSRSGTIEVTLEPSQLTNAVSFFGLSGNTVNVTVTVPGDGEVYNRTEPLQDNTSVVDWYSYFFEPIIQRGDITFLDLPQYGDPTIDITIDAGAGTAMCGECVVGRQRLLGATNFGTSVSIQDYSRKETDQFGNVTVVQRRFTKRADFDVTVNTNQVSAVQRALAEIRTTPTVFIGDEDRAETVVYGFYRGFSIVLDAPSISSCSIEVEGLV